MAGSQCWQKMTQSLEKRQPYLRKQGQRNSGREGVESPQPKRSGHVDVSDEGPDSPPVRPQLDLWDLSEVFSCGRL